MKRILILCMIMISSLLALAGDGYTHYKGTVGPYAIKLKLKANSQGDGGGWNRLDYTGSYTYTKAGNTLHLEGCTSLMSHSEIVLIETTPKGKVSADWVLHYTDSGLAGTMTVRKDKKTYNVKLKKVK